MNNLTGTWIDLVKREANITDKDGTLTVTPGGGGTIWWTSASGSWQLGKDPKSGDMQGKMAFENSSTTQDLIFCVALGCKTLVFSNGEQWTLKS